MVKVLLINPRFSESVDETISRTSVPLGLLCIGSYLEEKGYKIRLIDGLSDSRYTQTIKREVNSSSYVGLSVMTTQIPDAMKICEEIKNTDPDLPIIWGGVHPTLFPAETCADPVVDFVVHGEGELTFLELIDARERGKRLEKIKGLTYWHNNRLVEGGPRAFLEMDELPLINLELLGRKALQELELVPTHASRGCPYRCTFCINPITKNYWRCKSPEKTVDELLSLEKYFKGRKLRFWDENFFVNRKKAELIIDGILEQGLHVEWETTVRADFFRRAGPELMKKIKKSGCYKLCMGAESGSQRILNLIKKDITVKDLIHSATMCNKFDIIPEYSFMIGLPTENTAEMRQTLLLIDKLRHICPKTEILGPQPFRPYPGSPIYNECIAEYGWRDPKTLREWAVLMEREWGYLSPKCFPWVSNPDFVECVWPYAHYALTSASVAMRTGVKVNPFFKFLFMMFAKLRWWFKYFDHPIEYNLATRAINRIKRGKEE